MVGCLSLVEDVSDLLGECDVVLFRGESASVHGDLRGEELVDEGLLCVSGNDFLLLTLRHLVCDLSVAGDLLFLLLFPLLVDSLGLVLDVLGSLCLLLGLGSFLLLLVLFFGVYVVFLVELLGFLSVFSFDNVVNCVFPIAHFKYF